jgi:glucose-6-phosphate isomerase
MTPDPVSPSCWKAVQDHYREAGQLDMRELFHNDPNRFSRFSLEAAGIFLDFSKNRINEDTFRVLVEAARQQDLAGWIDRMFRGEKINLTENRRVLHTALRNQHGPPLIVDGKDILPAVRSKLENIGRFVEAVHGGDWRGCTGKRVKDIVNIGIGGSDLGPRMVVDALHGYAVSSIKSHFVANVDGTDLSRVLSQLDPQTSLFVIASKTFQTPETMINARSARQWFLDRAGPGANVARHFVAVSADSAEVQAFGIDLANLFETWDWVGGRYSLWSANGLSIALSIGMAGFEDLLKGARGMDEHFRTTPFEKNMPVILALVGIWNRNFLGAQTLATLPYDHRLQLFPAYLQQLDMESNGKTIDRYGRNTSMQTAPIVWGGVGTNGQHAFYQLIHQGSDPVPVDFIVALQGDSGLEMHHRVLVANCFAQAEALMRGKTTDEALVELTASAEDGESMQDLARHKTFAGNRPSNTIVIDRLTSKSLGALIALYEHKVFVQGVMWGINSFDQWGVELGKKLVTGLLEEIKGESFPNRHDSSTNGLLARFKDRNGMR